MHFSDISPCLGISVFPPPTVSSHDDPGVAEIAKAERLRIEQEHRSILENVLQEVLTEQPTSFDAIYENYSDKCTSRELQKKLDEPRVRFSVKQYFREMENDNRDGKEHRNCIKDLQMKSARRRR